MTQADRHGWFRASEPDGPCPAPDELWSFSRGELASVKRDEIRTHLTGCVWCGEKLARLGETAPADPEKVPAELDRRLRSNWQSDPLIRVWRSPLLWTALFVSSIGVSFADPRHYKQWLVIALVTGVRWAMSERARHQITLTRSSRPAEDGSRSAKRLDGARSDTRDAR